MPTDILTSLHGRVGGYDRDGRHVCRGYKSGVPGTDPGQIVLDEYFSARRFDDFTGATQAYSTTVVDGWRSRKGSDGACVDWTVAASTEGSVVGTIGNTTASMAVSGTQLDAGLGWKPNQGGLILEARVKLSVITNIACFVGFTDQVAALEMPIQSAASVDTFTTNATDGVGFMFDTSMSTDVWWLTGVKNDVDATMQQATIAGTAQAPVAATYAVLRVEVQSDGQADFFYNGKQVGSRLAAATTATIALTPVIAGFNRTTTGAPTITADYVLVAGNRV